jgi:uncharacterized protein (DUF302 family)
MELATDWRLAMRQIFIGLLLLVTAITAPAADNGIISKPSQYSVQETISRLEAVLKEKNVTVFAKIDHAAQAEKAGLTMRPAQLLIFGNPKGGTPVMNAAPLAAIDLPLKALAWQDAQGKVWLSFNSPAYLKKRHNIPDDLMKPIAGIGSLVEQALK